MLPLQAPSWLQHFSCRKTASSSCQICGRVEICSSCCYRYICSNSWYGSAVVSCKACKGSRLGQRQWYCYTSCCYFCCKPESTCSCCQNKAHKGNRQLLQSLWQAQICPWQCSALVVKHSCTYALGLSVQVPTSRLICMYITLRSWYGA